MEDDDTIAAVASLILPRYRLADYDNPRATHTPEDTKNIADIRVGEETSADSSAPVYSNGCHPQGTPSSCRCNASAHVANYSSTRSTTTKSRWAPSPTVKSPSPTKTSKPTHPCTAASKTVTQPCAHRYQKEWINSGVFTKQLRSDLGATITRSPTAGPVRGADSTRDSKINALVDLLRAEHPGESSSSPNTSTPPTMSRPQGQVSPTSSLFRVTDKPAAARRFSQLDKLPTSTRTNPS